MTGSLFYDHEMKVTTLGSLPWSDDELRNAYFRDFQNAYRAVEEHPGADVERTLQEMRFSVDLFVDLADDLIRTIKGFKAAAADPLFWSRARRADFNHFERQIRKALFGATSAALALVDHARRSSGKFQIDGYKEKLREIFDAEQHRFIQNLRNFASHVSVLMPEWEQRHESRQTLTKLLLMPEYLLLFKDWSRPARAFIERYPQGIELEELFSDYQRRVTAFYDWYLSTIEEQFGSSLQEYERYRRTLDRFGVHSFWMMLLSQVVIPRRLDPYEYLYRYLTEAEFAEVQQLPPRSRVQVDRIISLIDDLGACDQTLRELVYRAFSVSP